MTVSDAPSRGPEAEVLDSGDARPVGRSARPSWLRARVPLGAGYARVKALTRDLGLNTVCEQAHCPNVGECWECGTATFLILGNVCTRACGFCAVGTGWPGGALDASEPARVGEAAERLRLGHAVITSVSRDDLEDGGASVFAACVREVRARLPRCSVELLIPDFNGDRKALAAVCEARPDILNHNVETVPRLYASVRSRARFERSLEILASSRQAGLVTKTGLMVGLGEGLAELRETIARLHQCGTVILTIGQYLRPSLRHLPVARYYDPAAFAELRRYALELGFAHVESGPLVRSSYRAAEQVRLSRISVRLVAAR